MHIKQAPPPASGRFAHASLCGMQRFPSVISDKRSNCFSMDGRLRNNRKKLLGKEFSGGVTRLEFLWCVSGRERLRVPLEYRFSTSTEKYLRLKIE